MRILSSEYAALKLWLEGRADIVPGRTRWEILRYLHPDGIGMIYQRKNGRLTAAGVAIDHIEALRNKEIPSNG